MATSFNVNLQITSAVGFRKPDYAITAPRPVMTTTWTLNGDIHPEIFTNTKFISMSTPDVYTLYPDSTSTAQVISISNQSNSTVTMVLPYFRSSLNGVVPVVKVDPSSALYTGSLLIPPKLAPNTTGTFTLAYYALEQGDYYIGIKSLFHSLRIAMFGIQLAENGKIVDWTCANYIWDKLQSKQWTWEELDKEFRAERNKVLTEFRQITEK